MSIVFQFCFSIFSFVQTVGNDDYQNFSEVIDNLTD